MRLSSTNAVLELITTDLPLITTRTTTPWPACQTTSSVNQTGQLVLTVGLALQYVLKQYSVFFFSYNMSKPKGFEHWRNSSWWNLHHLYWCIKLYLSYKVSRKFSKLFMMFTLIAGSAEMTDMYWEVLIHIIGERIQYGPGVNGTATILTVHQTWNVSWDIAIIQQMKQTQMCWITIFNGMAGELF